MFKVTDDEYVFYKNAMREVAHELGRTNISKDVLKEFSLYLLDFMEHDDRAVGLLVGIALEDATRDLLSSYLVSAHLKPREFGQEPTTG